MILDFRAWEPHFADHLAPIWHALNLDERGAFVASKDIHPHLLALGIPPADYDQHTPGAPVIVASYQDLKRARAHGPVIYMEHGAGQTYTNPTTGAPLSGSYLGHPDRSGIILTLLPGPYAERAHRAATDAPSATVGCPKLDRWLIQPTVLGHVGFAWHWDCRICPETGSAFMEHRAAIRDMHRRAIPMRGHAHPRADWRMRRLCDELAIPYTDSLDTLVATCQVLVADNTSVIYEWAALDRPVVIVNSKRYRRDVHHGLRFWSHIPGELVERPDRLRQAVTRALTDDPTADERRRIISDVYANIGTAAAAAVAAIREALK